MSTNVKTVFVCKDIESIPKTKHWAIVANKTATVPGYDPGDRPETLHYTEYTAYLDKDQWELAVVKAVRSSMEGYSKTSFVAMEVVPAIINTEVRVSMSEN